MKVLSYPRFPYPNFWQGHAWCDVDVYRQGLNVLVVLRDQADHGGTSVTNALEIVAREVRERLLAPQGLERMTTYWIEWSRTDGVASTVVFRHPERLEGPTWQYLSPEEFQKILAAFEAPDQLEAWIREGSLELKEWEDFEGPELPGEW
ncbi:hypothetical protein [Meiothermus sp. Pnk-1]|uniref:hypothetical protein n=1 Tax=Meiothermus sp. Pnk-1 TaxID=873128 RepID=UPI000D7CA501|nr:hypothetical protein [Meiothermus sp. Pnk-1]PZA07463.1 hypothetical protein DNA98_07500 [Meiothermus sp. Pnk-1]